MNTESHETAVADEKLRYALWGLSALLGVMLALPLLVFA